MRLEFLLCSGSFARPRQFVVHSDQVLDGCGLQELLQTHFGPGPWYCAGAALEEHPDFTAHDALIITDLPTPQTPTAVQTLQLYVLDGPNAGAHITLHPGTHQVGRCAPLWLEDPGLARVQAIVQVDHRHITLRAEPGEHVQLLGGPGQPVQGAIRLQRGSLIRMGHTTFKVQDPLTELGSVSARWPQNPPQLPAKPEVHRMLTLLGAAVVPVAIGTLLALFTGSKIFLLISVFTALLAGIPLTGLIRSRIAYRHTAKEHSATYLALRQQLAPALGTVLAAAATPGAQLLPGADPPLVLGRGRWFPHAGSPAGRGFGTQADYDSDALRGSGHPSPVFALKATGAWQLVGEAEESGIQVLCAMLARLLPTVLNRSLSLVIDPALPLLPASLLLLPNTRLGLPPPAQPRAAQTVNNSQDRQLVYVLCGAAYPVPGALVLGIGTQRGEQLDGWVHLDTARAQLDDPQARLEQLERLSIAHFARLIDRWLALGLQRPADAAHPAASGTLRCILGDDQQGLPVSIDLEHDGPHLLLAGTTGSGKSEALRRIVAELVAQYSPHQLALALVDFKGGASLSVFASLPHTQLFCSDLDGAQALRMLQQLEIEIRRREQLLHDAGCSDIAEYQQTAQNVPVLPRLLVVVDEFRVFIDQLPEAGSRIDRIATVGRALGIHLLLSTQKPTGTLSGQTRANINTIIALRVRDGSESSELIGNAQAAQLSHPGQAILRSANSGPTQFLFRLAAAPPPVGYLAERADTGFAQYRHRPLGPPTSARQGMDLLRQRLERITHSWPEQYALPNPFAPPLPESIMQEPTLPASADHLLCGVLDELPHGRLLPLELGPTQSPTLLVTGLPEAGPGHLANQLFSSGLRLLCFDAAPQQQPDLAAHQLLLTGTDTYLFSQALDFLASCPDLRGILVVVRNMAGLLAALPASLWTRFDQVIATLIRTAEHSGVQLVILGDRDLSLLKASQLCTRRWYFPLGAPPGLTMSWPKLPPVSALPGRGVQVGPDGQLHSIQLTKLGGAPFTPATGWGYDPQPPGENAGWFVGTSGLQERSIYYAPTGIGFIIVPDQALRYELAKVLCARWGVLLCTEESELAQSTASAIVLTGAPTPSMVAVINSMAARGDTPLVFCAPSARLAYDFALRSMVVDERDVLVVEAMHTFDMQPLNWPVLAPATDRARQQYWRAVKLCDSQPTEVRIARRD